MGEIINWDSVFKWDDGFNGRLGRFLMGIINMEEILILVGNRLRLNNSMYKS